MRGQGSDEFSDQDTQGQPKIQLSSKKLILLFSDNYKKEVELVHLDNHIRKISDIYVNGYKFPVFGLKYNGNEYKYVILYAEEPLESIKRMHDFGGSKRVHVDQVKDRVKLLYRTLVSEILIKDDYCRNKCIPVLMSAARSLDNGGLVEQIMYYVRTEECESNAKEHTKSHSPPVKREPQETDETLEPNLADWPSGSDMEGPSDYNLDYEGVSDYNPDLHEGFSDYNPDQNSERDKDLIQAMELQLSRYSFLVSNVKGRDDSTLKPRKPKSQTLIKPMSRNSSKK